jgi:hypothetical protein
LICHASTSCSPNGPSEQPQRRPGVRERFRAASVSPRCTADREKRPNSWAFQGRSASRERVRSAGLGGRGGFELSVPDRIKIARLWEWRRTDLCR